LIKLRYLRFVSHGSDAVLRQFLVPVST
jgi:hypothetical protein